MTIQSASPCGWHGPVETFISTDSDKILSDISRFVSVDLMLPIDHGQKTAWRDSIRVLRASLKSLLQQTPHVKNWHLIFEYELPRERGRRPDVVLLAGQTVLVLEFKQDAIIEQAHVDQTATYARDIQHYHAASHGLSVVPLLVLTRATSLRGTYDEIYLASPDSLASALSTIASSPTTVHIDAEAWLQADYAPLPTLVHAARSIFEHDPLPYIRRAHSAGIPQTIDALISAANEAQATRTHHLALVTGVPGSGKTLVGLQFVYHSHFDTDDATRTAVFLSGNGPLVQVLQHALKSSVFVQDVHGFLRQYGGARNRRPDERIVVFDEAQRAWDAQRVGQKRGQAVSEPEDFLSIGGRHDWALMIGLIGEGQEIHLGEESGLGQWNDAIRSNGTSWAVHCPPEVAPIFKDAKQVNVSSVLNLTTSLRTHLAEDVQTWVQQLLDDDLIRASAAAQKVRQQGFDMYITRDLDLAKQYLRERYQGQSTKRYGLIASSKAKNLPKYGIRNDYMFTKNVRVGPWYNDEPTSPDSCCQLKEVVTEFSCQGLELDFPLICWGDDFFWQRGAWISKSSPRSSARDPHRLRLNSYRVLLTRGRDGFVVFVPPEAKLDSTFKALRHAGLQVLPP